MADWFRNMDWNEGIAAGFEQKLARSRRPAEYLVLQGYTLMPRRPEIAEWLLERAVALDDPQQTARAALYRGTALAVLGRFDDAIAALDLAMATERRFPQVRTVAWLDHALLVAFTRRESAYDAVLERLADEGAMPFEDQLLSALIAGTLIRGERGDDVALAARAALVLLGEGASDAPSYGGLSHRDLAERLLALTGAG
jgi:hypothetical protein